MDKGQIYQHAARQQNRQAGRDCAGLRAIPKVGPIVGKKIQASEDQQITSPFETAGRV